MNSAAIDVSRVSASRLDQHISTHGRRMSEGAKGRYSEDKLANREKSRFVVLSVLPVRSLGSQTDAG